MKWQSAPSRLRTHFLVYLGRCINSLLLAEGQALRALLPLPEDWMLALSSAGQLHKFGTASGKNKVGSLLERCFCLWRKFQATSLDEAIEPSELTLRKLQQFS